MSYSHQNMSVSMNTTVIPLVATHTLATPTTNRDDDTEQLPPLFPGSNLLEFGAAYSHIHGYLSAVVCAFGILANLANIIVLTRKNMITSTNVILAWLAVADLLTMISYFPVSIHFYILKDPGLVFPQTTSSSWINFLLFHSNFGVICHSIAIWLTIALAVFRYIYVCYPTRGSTLCSLYRAKMVILLVYISTVIILIPNYLSNGIAHERFEDITIYTILETKLARKHPIIRTLNVWLQGIIIKIIPCVLLVILTVLLIKAMREANERRRMLKSQGRMDDSDRAREHNRTTAMLLAIIVLFLITELPQGITAILNSIDNRFMLEIYLPLGDLFDILALINNAINFVLYTTMSRQFRDTFVEVFCKCCTGDKRPGWLRLSTFEQKNGIQMKNLNSHNRNAPPLKSTQIAMETDNES